MDCSQVIKDAIPRKTLNKFRLVMVICWIAVGTILCGVFSGIESKESRFDFRCINVTGDIEKDSIRDKCYHQYLQNHQLGIPPYAFILINVSAIPIVTLLYSWRVKSTVKRLERNHQGAEGEPTNQRRSRRLFIAYLFQLVVSIALGIIFIVLLETYLLYPTNFPCPIKKLSVKFFLNRTQSTNLFSCFHDRAGYKNFWTKTATVANGIFAIFAFLEILWILWRARNEKRFMCNRQFYADHLKLLNSDEKTPLIPKDFQSAMKTLKENCLWLTEQPSDLKHPIRRPNPGQGFIHNLKMDEIYVNVAIHEGTAHHNFAEDLDRWERLKEYPPDAKDCHFAKPEDIIDKEHTNVLVVGRPGIGKTSLSTKMLRLWASGEAFNEDHHEKSAHFNVVFLMKFRRFNDNAELSLRELLARAETVQSLDDPVWDFINKESTKVLLIFDGVDEYSRKEDINAQEDDPTFKNDVEEMMPVSVLYNKLAAGKLLRGASILTTTRPTAVEYVAHVNFQRTVEIRGFTSENVEDYVEKFTRGVPGAKEKMWGHIKSNINLFSLCYIPMNCFLICHCLLLIIHYKSSQALPTKITDIYKMTVKMVFFNHNREGFTQKELEKLKSTYMYKPFEKFPKDVQEMFSSLGEIAFKGIGEGRLLFESSEVSGLEDCGLLHKLPDEQPPPLSDEEPKPQFCFTHLTVQEFFAAKHLVDNKTDKGIEEFVRNHIDAGTWQVVLQFVAGLLKNSSADIFIKLLPKSTQERRIFESSEQKTLTSWPATKEDKHLAVQVCKCLYEINDKQQPKRLQEKIEEIDKAVVDFSHCSLAPIDLAAVLHFLENAQEVLRIDLSDNGFGDLGAKEAKNFLVNRERKLKWLDLMSNNFTDKAAEDLAEALKHSNCKLESLYLILNNFTDKAAKDLATAVKHSNCKLKELHLSGDHFTDKAAKDFAEALKHSNCKLESLYLNFSSLTDKAAEDFAAALKHSNCKLKRLYLGGDKFTTKGHRYLTDAEKHSNCKVLSKKTVTLTRLTLSLKAHNLKSCTNSK